MKRIGTADKKTTEPRESKVQRALPGIRKIGPGRLEVRESQSLDEMLAHLSATCGVRRDAIAVRLAQQVVSSFVRPPEELDSALKLAIGTIAEMAPQNITEAMLGVQMTATHEAILMFLQNATRDEQTIEGRDANVNRAARLMRVHLDQVEAMQKLKGKTGQQKVIVEHVHVHEGGQAIVGAMSTAKPGEGGK